MQVSCKSKTQRTTRDNYEWNRTAQLFKNGKPNLFEGPPTHPLRLHCAPLRSGEASRRCPGAASFTRCISLSRTFTSSPSARSRRHLHRAWGPCFWPRKWIAMTRLFDFVRNCLYFVRFHVVYRPRKRTCHQPQNHVKYSIEPIRRNSKLHRESRTIRERTCGKTPGKNIAQSLMKHKQW